MSSAAVLQNWRARFNAMSLRERGMIALAVLAVLVLSWSQLLLKPLHARQQALTLELTATQQNLELLSSSIEDRARDNPIALAMKQKQDVTASLAVVDGELKSASAGLIPPDRMLQALRDVLATQQGVRLISMRNFPVSNLVPAEQAANGTTAPAITQGPYVHSLELVLEGGYLDLLRYLQRVEALPWRFYWQILELKAGEYPLNKVRIRLNTLSMDQEWLGV